MDIKFDKGIKMPPKLNHGRLDFLAQMEVGDSFFVGELVTHPRLVATQATSWARSRKLNWKFSQRTTSEGVRLWRVK